MAEHEKKQLNHAPLFWVATASGIGLMALAAWLIDLKALHHWAESLNAFCLLALMAVLPLTGVPASILYVVVGAKFGHGWGLLAAAVAISFQLCASWWIAHSWLKRPLEHLLKRFNRRKPQVPEGQYVPVCLLVALMPGASYAFKNYLLVLGGIPFRQFFWTCLPVHLVTASLGIFFGGFTGSMSPPKIIFLVCYAALLFGLSRYVLRRLKRHQPQTRGGRQTQQAQDAPS